MPLCPNWNHLWTELVLINFQLKASELYFWHFKKENSYLIMKEILKFRGNLEQNTTKVIFFFNWKQTFYD